MVVLLSVKEGCTSRQRAHRGVLLHPSRLVKLILQVSYIFRVSCFK